MSARYKISMTFPVGEQRLFQACLQSVSRCGFRVITSDPQAPLIRARAQMSFLSLFGEIITMSVVAEGTVNIVSSTRGMQLLDYGKNKRNVRALSAALSRSLSDEPTGPPGA